jgi:hypothetical protein
VKTIQQAEIAARIYLRTTRLHFLGDPAVRRVDRMSYAEAHDIAKSPGAYEAPSKSGDEPVWLVIFAGVFQIVPPMSAFTPEAAGPGCAYVIVAATSGGGFQGGTFDCGKLESR